MNDALISDPKLVFLDSQCDENPQSHDLASLKKSAKLH
jgi:hypothetical protein